MASRKTFRGRKAPFRRRNRFLFRGRWWKIVYFDGYGLRHMQPDIDIMLWHGDGNNDFVPPGQLWIDRRYRAEVSFQLEVFQIEKMKKWTKRGDNDRYPPYKELREYLKEKLCKGPIPEFVERREWDAANQLKLVYVRGDIVRRCFDPHFVFGGHDLVYPYIEEPRTIWIDACQDPREIKYTLIHETLERKLMERGWRYGPAHNRAIRAELKLRAQEYVNADKEEKMPMPPKPLKVKPIEQSDVGCGPTSAKMLLDYDGIVKEDGTPYSEDELIVLCGCDPETGTDHAPLVEGMRKIAGDRVVHGQDATIDDLRRIVLEERRPVMIGWWTDDHLSSEQVRADPDLDGGHYSVVVHLNRKRVQIADPWIIDPEDEDDGAPGLRELPIGEFKKRWYDMDGNPTESDLGYHVVRGWYLYLREAGSGEPKP